jgi:hypothetical protein
VPILGLSDQAVEMLDEVRISTRAQRIAPGISNNDRKSGGLLPECSNPKCSMGWTRMLRRRNTPVFEGEWVCSENCLRERVMKMLRLDMQTGTDEAPHQHRIPLGLVLLAQGWITHPQLKQALDAQQRSGRGKIGSWLMSEFGLREERITRALSLQWSCPVISSDGFEPIRMALAAPSSFCEHQGAVPVRVAGGRILYVAFEDRMDMSAAVAMEHMTGLRVECGLMNGSQISEARRRLMNAAFAPCKTAVVADVDTLATEIAREIESARPVESRLARVHDQFWLRLWLRRGDDFTGDLPLAAGAVRDVVFTLASKAH